MALLCLFFWFLRACGGQATLAQLAVLWLLRRPEVTTVLIGASKVAQLDDLHGALSQPPLAEAELVRIDAILR